MIKMISGSLMPFKERWAESNTKPARGKHGSLIVLIHLPTRLNCPA
jgi:hypothetical protein